MLAVSFEFYAISARVVLPTRCLAVSRFAVSMPIAPIGIVACRVVVFGRFVGAVRRVTVRAGDTKGSFIVVSAGVQIFNEIGKHVDGFSDTVGGSRGRGNSRVTN